MACQQFYADRVNADFCHKDNGLREDRASRMAHTDGEEENGQCARTISGRAMAVYQPLPGWSQAMMPKYMAMPRPSRSRVIRKMVFVGKNTGRQKIHRTMQMPMT